MYKVGKANVRIHGEADREKLNSATQRFVKQIHKRRVTKCLNLKSASTTPKIPN